MTHIRRSVRVTSHNHRFTSVIQTLRHYITNYGKLPFVEYSVVKDQLLGRLRGPEAPCRFLARRAVRVVLDSQTLRSSKYYVAVTRRGPASLLRSGGATLYVAANLVENTGLEPVTSWMQTRRSPS